MKEILDLANDVIKMFWLKFTANLQRINFSRKLGVCVQGVKWDRDMLEYVWRNRTESGVFFAREAAPAQYDAKKTYYEDEITLNKSEIVLNTEEWWFYLRGDDLTDVEVIEFLKFCIAHECYHAKQFKDEEEFIESEANDWAASQPEVNLPAGIRVKG